MSIKIRNKKGKVLLLVAATIMSVYVFAQTSLAKGVSDNPAVTGAAAASRTISTTGSADVMVNPDQVVFTLAVETDNKDIMKAKADNDARISKIMAITKEYSIDSKYVKTDYINVNPKYTYKPNGDNVFTGYEIHRGMVITLKDLTKFDEFLTRLLAAGANYVQNVQFTTTELRKYKDQARSLAIRAAKEKAEALAKEIGQTTGKAISVQEIQEDAYSYYSPWGSGQYAVNAASNTLVNAQATNSPSVSGQDYAPGQIKVSAKISVVFDLN